VYVNSTSWEPYESPEQLIVLVLAYEGDAGERGRKMSLLYLLNKFTYIFNEC